VRRTRRCCRYTCRIQRHRTDCSTVIHYNLCFAQDSMSSTFVQLKDVVATRGALIADIQSQLVKMRQLALEKTANPVCPESRLSRMEACGSSGSRCYLSGPSATALCIPCLVLSLYFDRLLGLIVCRALMHG
jgi:hypothetical protein